MKRKKIILITLATVLVLIGIYFGYQKFINNHQVTTTNYANFDSDKANGCTITNDVVSITSGGVYAISGTTKEGYVDVNTTDDVELILNNTSITSSTTAAIRIENANSIKITLAKDTTNTLTGGDKDKYDAALAAHAPLIIEGDGTLYANGTAQEGIATKSNDITINSGNIYVSSLDDGINAGGDGGLITINNGNIYIDAQGDGIDSNKDLVINSGTIFVMGSSKADNAGIDTDGSYKINGGTLIALGNGMMQTPDADSEQKVVLFNLDSSIQGNVLVTLSNDEKWISFMADREFKTITISTPNITDSTYHLYTGGNNSGTINMGIYSDGQYTKGTMVNVNNTTDFVVNSTTNWFGNTDNMEGQPSSNNGLQPQY